MSPSDTSPRRLHPLIATAAASLIVASLAATAAITGLFPKASSTSAQTGQTQSAQVGSQSVVDTTAPARVPQAQAPQRAAAPTAQRQPYAQPRTAQPYQRAATACSTCGTVESVRAIRREGRGTGLGAVGGAVAGGLVGNQFGAGNGRAAMTVLGAVGGGFAGNAVEKNLRSETDYQVRVRTETGHTRYFTYRNPPPFQPGEPVRIEHGTLAAR